MTTPENETGESRDLPIETKTYADGTQATGVAPLPDESPAEQNGKTDSSYAQDVLDDLKHDIMTLSQWPQHIVDAFESIFATHRAKL